MKIVFGGVRGTDTLTGSEFSEYGGDTTSFLLEASDNRRILVDLGSGAHNVRERATSETGTLPILMTHYHLDHLSGLPVFSPLYDPGVIIDCLGPVLGASTCESVFRSIFSSPLWPIPLEALSADIRLRDLPAPARQEPYEFHGFTITWCPLHHFEGAVAYRVTDPGSGVSVVIATDMEWRESTEEEQEALLELCRAPKPADALIFDGHVDENAYSTYRGWGHSTWRDALAVDEKTRPDRLFLTHHAPYHDDEHLKIMEADMQAEKLNARLARQGQEVEID